MKKVFTYICICIAEPLCRTPETSHRIVNQLYFNEINFEKRNKWLSTCSNMDGPILSEDREGEISYNIPYMWNFK